MREIFGSVQKFGYGSDLSNPGMEHKSPAWQEDSLLTELPATNTTRVATLLSGRYLPKIMVIVI